MDHFSYLGLSCFLVCSLQPCGHLLVNGLYVMFSCVFVTFVFFTKASFYFYFEYKYNDLVVK